jgi:hypothetical protein
MIFRELLRSCLHGVCVSGVEVEWSVRALLMKMAMLRFGLRCVYLLSDQTRKSDQKIRREDQTSASPSSSAVLSHSTPLTSYSMKI